MRAVMNTVGNTKHLAMGARGPSMDDVHVHAALASALEHIGPVCLQLSIIIIDSLNNTPFREPKSHVRVSATVILLLSS